MILEEEGEVWANPEALAKFLSGLDYLKDLENQACEKNLTLEQFILQLYPRTEEPK